MAQRITQKLICDVADVTCDRPVCIVWLDRLSRPGVYVFEKERTYTLSVEQGGRYRLPFPSSNTLRGMVAETGAMRAEAVEGFTVYAGFVERENAKALDAIRHAQVVFQYDMDAPEDYLKWRRVFPSGPANEIPERWEKVNEIRLSFEYDPIYNL